MLRRTEAAARDGTTGSVSSSPRKVAPDHIELTSVAEFEGAWSSEEHRQAVETARGRYLTTPPLA
jgi:hypothetical protein